MKTTILDEDSSLKRAYKKLENYFDDNKEAMVSLYGTCLACAKTLGEHILQTSDIRGLDENIGYMLALTWNLYAQVYDPDRTENIKINMETQNYFEHQSLDKRFATIVKQLYDICKEKKLL